MKKTILILIGIILLGGGVYLFIQAKQTPQVNKETGETTGFRSFFPFNANKNSTTDIVDNTDTNTEENVVEEDNTVVAEENRLTQITNFAVSGVTVFMAEREIEEKKSPAVENTETPKEEVTFIPVEEKDPKKTTPTKVEEKKEVVVEKPKTEIVEALRYVEKSTGHIYEYHLDKKLSGKISNSTIPGVYEALFGNTSQSVLYRYVDNQNQIQSYLATLGAQKGQFLAPGISSAVLSPDKENIFYVNKLGESLTGINLTIKSGASKQIFSSEFTEWLPQWATKQAIFMNTKPSWNIKGSLYALNVSTGALTKVFGGVEGMTTLVNNEGNRIIYNKTTNSGPLLGVFSNNNLTSLNVYGLPEKCVWSKDSVNIYCAVPNTLTTNHLPDMWYQGIISFSDTVIKIDSRNGERYTVTNTESTQAIDAINLQLSQKEDYLFFINKKDGTLWKLAL